MSQPLERGRFHGASIEVWQIGGRSIEDLILEAEQTRRIDTTGYNRDVFEKAEPSPRNTVQVSTVELRLGDIFGNQRLNIDGILNLAPKEGLTECSFPDQIVLYKAIKDARENPYGPSYLVYVAMKPRLKHNLDQEDPWTPSWDDRVVLGVKRDGGRLSVETYLASHTHEFSPDAHFLFEASRS